MNGTNGAIKDFVHSPLIPDPVLRALTDIETRLTTAWKNNQCLECPLGELAALAAATRTFYQESRHL